MKIDRRYLNRQFPFSLPILIPDTIRYLPEIDGFIFHDTVADFLKFFQVRCIFDILMILKIKGFPFQYHLQPFQFRFGHPLPDIIFFRMDGKPFPVIVVFHRIMQDILLPTYLTGKIILCRPAHRGILAVYQYQVLHIFCP